MEGNARLDWLRQRKTGLGGTDAAAILGMSPFATAHDVLMDKTDPQVVDAEPAPAMLWGTLLEPVILERYAEVVGAACWERHQYALHRHPAHHALFASPDAVVTMPDGERFGVDAKTTSAWSANAWGEPGTDQVPDAYVIQAAHYMACLDLPRWDIAVLIGGQDFRTYTIRRDAGLEQVITDTLVAWWDRHVERGDPLPIDGSAACAKYLERRFASTRPRRIAADGDLLTRGCLLATITQEMRSIQALRDQVTNEVKSLLGEYEGAETDRVHGSVPPWSVTWKWTRPRTTVDWKAVAADLRDAMNAHQAGVGDVVLADATAKRTDRVPGSRRFTFTVKGTEGNEQ